MKLLVDLILYNARKKKLKNSKQIESTILTKKREKKKICYLNQTKIERKNKNKEEKKKKSNFKNNNNVLKTLFFYLLTKL